LTVKTCLFPVAGYGTRFLPATKSMPKEMLPILNKPLIHYAVEEALDGGLTQMALVTGRGKRAIEDYFDITYELEDQISGTPKQRRLTSVHELIDRCTFSYTRQVRMKGLGHAILTGHILVGNDPFGVILADDLCVNDGPGVMAQMLEVHRRSGCSVVAIEEVPAGSVDQYGIIAGDDRGDGIYQVSEMVEKPRPGDAPSNLAIIGRYLLTPDIFDILRSTEPGKGGEIQITDALNRQAREGRVLAYRFQGRRFDCGSVDGFVAATNFFYQRYQDAD
jgi:UTP--glucose-1-phosphate uridylyltransferase